MVVRFTMKIVANSERFSEIARYFLKDGLDLMSEFLALFCATVQQNYCHNPGVHRPENPFSRKRQAN